VERQRFHWVFWSQESKRYIATVPKVISIRLGVPIHKIGLLGIQTDSQEAGDFSARARELGFEI
jgi:hypothetical protein